MEKIGYFAIKIKQISDRWKMYCNFFRSSPSIIAGIGLCFHIEPGQSFMGGGVYKPASGNLKAIRRYIARFPEEFEEMIQQPDFKDTLPEMYDDQVKTVPKGFSADHEFIHLLRYRSFVFSAGISDEELISGKFIEKAVEAFRRLAPVNAYLNEAFLA